MEVLKCGNCGGQLNYKEGDSIAKCPFCGYETNLKNIGEETVVRGIAISDQGKISNLTKRMSLLLEDEDFKKASEVADNILNLDPENADAYLGKLFIDLGIKNEKCITDKYIFLDTLTENKNYKRVIQFGSEKQKEKIKKIIENKKILFKNISLTIKDRLILSMSKIKESQETFTFEKKSIACTIVSSIIGIIIIIIFFISLNSDQSWSTALFLIFIVIVITNFKIIKENKLKTQLEKKIHEANSEIAYKQILEAPNKFDSKEKIKQFYVAYLIIEKKDYQNTLNIVTEVVEEEYQKIKKLEKEIDESKNYKVKLLNIINKDSSSESKIKQIESKLSKQIKNRKILLDKLDKIHILKYQLEYIIAIEKEDFYSIDKQLKNLVGLIKHKHDFTGIVTLYNDKIQNLV